jgi:hypothetical protein
MGLAKVLGAVVAVDRGGVCWAEVLIGDWVGILAEEVWGVRE